MDEDEARTTDTDLSSDYANNCRLEPTVWDLTLFFGQWYQFPKPEVDWHTAITIPWLQAKLLAHFLRVNVALFEREHGKLSVPERMRPPNDDAPATPAMEMIKKMHDEFFGPYNEDESPEGPNGDG